MSPAAAATARMANPYAKPAQNAVNMGRQSQQRVSNQHKRKYKLCSNNNRKKKKGDQLTLQGDVASNPERDCIICRAKSIKKLYLPNYRIPKRSHHELCPSNTTTRGLGELTEASLASLADNKRCKALTAPIQPGERYSGKHATKAVAEFFFAPVEKNPKMTTMTAAATATVQENTEDDDVAPIDLSETVKRKVNDVGFRDKHKSKGAPLAMIAFADEVADKIITKKKFHDCFRGGVVMEVPACHGQFDNPHHHSVVGQKLLYIDWQRTHGIQVPCPDSKCAGTLGSPEDRSNFSKNENLFPIYGLEGPPIWCIVMVYKCPCCKRNFNANEADILVNLPDYAASCYPVDSTCARKKAKCHLNRNATEAFSSIMVTYGNGELCSKLLHNAINRDYIRRIKGYYSLAKQKKGTTVPCIEKDGEFVRQHHRWVTPSVRHMMSRPPVRRILGASAITTDTLERFKVSRVPARECLPKTTPFK